MTSVPDTLVFKALVHEIKEIEPRLSAIEILHIMCDSSRWLAEDCEYFFFFHDDGQITEEEAFLLEWLRTMEQSSSEVLRQKLLPVAHKLAQNSRY